jgi:hypothetical protein
MSYSRRQLEALGEPLGDCVTRKEGGRIIYGGGGSSSPPATQTQVSDLPDWAKPTAQKLLSKAEALVEGSPYQQYKGERIAGFSPLQQQAFQGAAQMDAGPQGFAQQVGQYMSPYMQNVVDREKMEAYRASQMLGQQQQARATQAGAFGGYREGIERAERERGLRSQLGDIQTRGLQSAYDRAADQFRTGITQGLAVGQQQAALGGQQQQREQSILSQQYQDFQNQQRYPYQQLEYLSGILRGTPMGTVSTLYGGQPNLFGQVAGLGAGLYGAFGKAEGGMVDSYAEGGVTSDENVENILSKLSDAQLMQAKQIAMAQRDAERVQMIDAELAERASMKSGLGGAFNMLPQEQQDAVTEMAGGGIVAFAGDERENDPLFGQLVSAEFGGGVPVNARSVNPFANFSSAFSDLSALGRTARGGKSIAEYYGEEKNRPYLPATPAETAAANAETSKLARLAASRGESTSSIPEPSARTSKKPGRGAAAAANAVANAAQQTTGANRTEMKAAFNEGLTLLKDTQGKADSNRMVELINQISKSEAPDKMDMLANFGFKMAAAASKPGATFLGAAAEGAQVVPEMRARAKKEAKEAQRLGITLEMEKLKFDAATRKGDRAAALQHAQNIRIMQGQEAQLGETKRSNLAREGLERQKIAAAKERAAAQQGRMTETMARIRAANAQKAMVDARKGWSDPLERKKLEAEFGTGQTGFAKYHKSLVDALQLQSLPQLELLGAVSSNTD